LYADRKEWGLGDVEVEVDYELNSNGTSRFDVIVRVPPEVSDEQAERLQAIAGRCPVHRTLVGEVEINDRVERVRA
jgi:putative redox protein